MGERTLVLRAWMNSIDVLGQNVKEVLQGRKVSNVQESRPRGVALCICSLRVLTWLDVLMLADIGKKV